MRPGRRVGSIEELEQSGDYYLNPLGDGDATPSLWFLLPRREKCPAEYRERLYFEDAWDQFWTGYHRIDGTWSIREEPDGSVTVSPSILTSAELGTDRVHLEWHGFLEHGTWREA